MSDDQTETDRRTIEVQLTGNHAIGAVGSVAPEPRWSIGTDPDTGELLVVDEQKHVIVARAGALAEPHLRALVDAANR